jgi:YaiO family outer membrane protein
MWKLRAVLAVLMLSAATARADDDKPRWSVDFDWINDEFSGPRGGEQTAMTQLDYRFSDRLTVYLHTEYLHHFNAYDQKYAVGALFEPNHSLAVSVEAGLADNPDFSPDHQAQIRVDLVEWNLLQPSIAYRYLDYGDLGHASTWTPGLRMLTPAGNVEFRDAFTRDIGGAHTSARSLKLFWILGEDDEFAFYVAGFNGQDALPPQTRADFWRVMTGLSWIVTREWEVRSDFGWEKRENSYIQRSFALGLTRRF